MTVCIETKMSLLGGTSRFRCQLLYREGGLGVLKYVIDRTYRIADITLHPGDITHAFFWTDRPYTLYVWHPAGSPVFYFNIADRIELRDDEFLWRDLVIDVLVDQSGMVRMLDEQELPSDLSPELTAYIRSASADVLRDHAHIALEVGQLFRTVLAGLT